METFDDGIIHVCTLGNQAHPGEMPKPILMSYKRYYYQDMMVGYSRQYAAQGVNEYIDLLVRIWQDRSIVAGMYAVIDGKQYRITQIQHLYNSDGLKVTDLTLAHLEDFYDYDSTVDSGTGCPNTTN